MPYVLQDRVMLVTGGAGDIGAARNDRARAAIDPLQRLPLPVAR